MAFRVGQKVVCVDAKPLPEQKVGWRNRLVKLREGSIYTIREIAPGNEIGLMLVEVRNEMHHSGREFHYYAWRFRPVVDISDLAAIVAEVKRGKPREIAPDKFDRQRVHSSTRPSVDGAPVSLPAAPRPAASPLSPAPICPERSASLCANSAARVSR